MSTTMFSRKVIPGRIGLWSAPARSLHWLAAASIMGAAVLTGQGDPEHDALGWLALGILLVWHWVRVPRYAPSPALILVTMVLTGMALSGWLAPAGGLHDGLTLVAAVAASWYGATVLFESLRRAEVRWLREA